MPSRGILGLVAQSDWQSPLGGLPGGASLGRPLFVLQMKHETTTVRLAGKSVKVRVASKRLKHKGDPVDGKCYFDKREIVISPGLSPAEHFETAVHEMLHMQGWHIDEEFVTAAAYDMTQALIKLGLVQFSG